MESLSELKCQVNALSVEELFDLYERLGFIYPEKRKQIAPYFGVIKSNWEKALNAGDRIITVLTYEEDGKPVASMCGWMSANANLFVQHAVSSNNPIASRALLLGIQATAYAKGDSLSNFFRPDNKWTMKCSGDHCRVLGPELSHLQKLYYVKVEERNIAKIKSNIVEILECKSDDYKQVYAFASQARNQVYAKAEGLDKDVDFLELNKIYNLYGLAIKRVAYLAFIENRADPVGLIIVNRAPLGFNLSFLESRCEILLSQDLSQETRVAVINHLLAATAPHYRDFEPGFMPLICEEPVYQVLINQNCELTREYMQCMWLKDGFNGSYNNTLRLFQKMYDRSLRRAENMVSTQGDLNGS